MSEMENKITDAKKEEIIKALKVIQDVCKSNEDCETCPFYSVNNPINRCSIKNESPYDWKIAEKNEKWRALL